MSKGERNCSCLLSMVIAHAVRGEHCGLLETCDPENHSKILFCQDSPVIFSTFVLQLSGDVPLPHLPRWHCVSGKGRKCVICVEITWKIDFLFAYEENGGLL